MTSRMHLFAGVTLLLGAPGLTSSAPFTIASVHFEQNATDKDFEVVFEIKGNGEGLAKLTVVAPDGRTVIDFTAPDGSTLGMRQFRFESPESDTAASLRSAYPEGVYTFAGTGSTGVKYTGQATLSHKLPPVAAGLRPAPDAEDVSPENLQISWTPVPTLTAVIVYIEQDEPEYNITARLPGSTASFAVPRGFLAPGTEYVLGIGTVTREGNVSFVEATFTTAGKE